eukprot:scaffold37956_cov48-Cyclotella_meneghiniana.AAC.3
MNIPTAETLHYATNTWNNRPSSPMPSLSKSTTTTTRIIDPYYDPMAFHTLREYIIRHTRGYVHPDLGYIIPAPSGAARGIGMVRDTYNQCQVYCYPGTAEEVLEHTKHDIDKVRAIRKDPWKDYPMIVEYPDIIKSPIMTAKTGTVEQIQNVLMKQSKAAYDNYNNNNNKNNDAPYTQQTLMMRIPLSAQITRHNALQILNPLIPEDFKATTPLEHLDDAFLLAILLVYEGGLRSKSRYWPYIATLPPHPSCAMHRAWRQSIVDVLTALSTEMGTDTRVWPNEIAKASDSMDKIAGSLMHFVSFFEYNHDMFQSHHEAMRWSLCQVASRAIAGNAEYGRLRLVPMMDMLNHDEAAEKFIELSGNETVGDGHFVGAIQDDAGTFVIRSSRYGRRKVLRRGQELMANYNVPHYSAFDWFLNMGYVPPERDGGYVMLDAALPKVGRRAKYKTPVAGEG